jgi:hypothetical protein
MRNITDDYTACNHTSNVTDLLSEDSIDLLRELTPEHLEVAFGRGQEVEDNDKGYGAEWYFQTWTGETVGIGFRHNEARLRGGDITEATAERFLGWVLGFIDLV